MLSDEQKKVARMILEKEALKLGAFRLKLHEKNPDAPLSPFYFNLRGKENPKPGTLEEVDYDSAAQVMYAKIMAADAAFEAIAPIPNAGGPFARALMKLIANDCRLIALEKIKVDGKRTIVPSPGFEYKKARGFC